MPDSTTDITPPDPLHEYRISKLEEAVSSLSATLQSMLTEIQRAKWVVGGAFLFSQHEDLAALAKFLTN